MHLQVQPLRRGTAPEELGAALARFGAVVGATVHGGRPEYGYVRFATEAEARAAVGAGATMVAGVMVCPCVCVCVCACLPCPPFPTPLIGCLLRCI